MKTIPRGKAIRFRVKFTDKIGDLKAKIQDQQRLLFKGQQLVDGQTLAGYNVKRKSTLRLDCSMQIFVDRSDPKHQVVRVSFCSWLMITVDICGLSSWQQKMKLSGVSKG